VIDGRGVKAIFDISLDFIVDLIVGVDIEQKSSHYFPGDWRKSNTKLVLSFYY